MGLPATSPPQFRIGDRAVGGDAPVLIIAELSANHGGRLETALATVEAAARAGADAIKLQTYTPDTLTLKCDGPPFVVRTNNAWANRTLYDLYAEAMTPWEWHAELKRAAEAHGLLFFSTPFDATAVHFLEALGVAAHKVASFEITDLTLVEAVAATGKPMIVSTGMASLGEIEAAVRVCHEAGNRKVALLRCVSAYPAKPESMDLAGLDVLRSFGVVVGLSDHTRDATTAIAAVALGAKILEKHFILRRDIGGPDSFFSLEPDELRATVQAVRAAEASLGRPRFGPADEERASLAFRRSLFFARAVTEGQVLTIDDVRSVRPSAGLEPRHLPSVLGRTATRSMPMGSPVAWSDAAPARPEPTLALRPAVADDAPQLLRWRNDPVTRAMSIAQAEVEAAQHSDWLASKLAATTSRLYVAVRGEVAVGQARLDHVAAGTWEVSLTVAPEHRRAGNAVNILLAAERAGVALGALRLVATIRPTNEASLRAFKAAGYYGFATVEEDGVTLVRCERRVVPYP